LFINLAKLDFYDFLRGKETLFKTLCDKFLLRNTMGSFFDPRKTNIEKIKSECPEEFEELSTR
jgi:hypothetical protein